MAGGRRTHPARRIKSVQSTKKITRAMELIAATRIVKAQQRVHAARPYADQITAVIRSLAAGGAGAGQPLLTPKRDVRDGGYIVIAADRGLAGAYNSGVIRIAERAHAGRHAPRAVTYSLIYVVGKKAEDYFRFRKYTIDAAFKGFTDNPSYEDAQSIAAAVVERVRTGSGGRRSTRSKLVYTQFLSAGSQKVMPRAVHAHRDRRRRQRLRRALGRTTSSSQTRPRSSATCCPATSRAGCTPRCSTPRRRSTQPASGP